MIAWKRPQKRHNHLKSEAHRAVKLNGTRRRSKPWLAASLDAFEAQTPTGEKGQRTAQTILSMSQYVLVLPSAKILLRSASPASPASNFAFVLVPELESVLCGLCRGALAFEAAESKQSYSRQNTLPCSPCRTLCGVNANSTPLGAPQVRVRGLALAGFQAI